MFEKVRNHTTVKVELIKREKKLLGIRAIECINILEDIISLTITLDLNEKKKSIILSVKRIQEIEESKEMEEFRKKFAEEKAKSNEEYQKQLSSHIKD